MTKPCRDSKGKFVSQEEKVWRLKHLIFLLGLVADQRQYDLRNIEMLGAWNNMPVHQIAQFLRQFRNRYKIYECF